MKSLKMMPLRRLDRTLLLAICYAAVITIAQCSSPPADSAKEPAKASGPTELKAKEEKPTIEAKSVVEPAKVAEQAKAPDSSDQTRKGRSDAPPVAAVASEPDQKSTASSQPAAPAESTKPTPKPSSASNSTSSTSQSKLSAKSGASSSNKKLPANLGTVTSTGSGGPAQYMASKQDAYSAYSAIAEKHGALESTIKRADKRNHMQRFGGIQKAGGFGDSLNPFKSVTDGGLARTLGASMRSIMKSKYSVPAYLASAVLGAVALMAFYESPISPLPVPALPEPPVGRFPPEMPVISPNLAVPFRMNQQQQYGNQQYGGQQQNGYANQRSFQATGLAPNLNQMPQQPQPAQQVLFPGATAQNAQQRQGLATGPVQQLAANLISTVSGKQTAQRKSGLDLEPDTSRSFFGSNKLSLPANQQPNQNKQQASASILSFLGLGNSNAAAAAGSQQQIGLGDIHRASGMGSHMSGSAHEQSAGPLSNSHLVNKMKSYFDRPVPHQSWSMDHNVPNQYDQYRRMSIMQALVKDTAFLSSYFTPSRRNSNATSSSPTSSLQQSISAVLNGNNNQVAPSPAASQQVASSRMQVDHVLPSLIPATFSSPVAGQPVQAKRTSSGFGLMRAALETLTSGLLHRSAESGSKKSSGLDEHSSQQRQQQQQQNALASSVSLLSDIMSSYNAAQQQAKSQQQQQQQQYQPTVQQADSNKQQQASASAASNQVGQSEQAGGRSADSTSSSENSSVSPAEQSPVKAAPSSSAAQPEPESSQQPLNRKVRSIGLEYQTGEPQLPHQNQQSNQQQQQQQQQSRASQINNLVDFVSDSYKQNKYLFNFVMNQAGLSQALPYVEQFLDAPGESRRNK